MATARAGAGGAGGAGGEARARHHERLIAQLEAELGATVQRLEAQRGAQAAEAARLSRDLLGVCEERQELRARAELAEQQVETFREELRQQLAQSAQERLELEKRAAQAETAAQAARESEARIMAQAAAMDSRIVAAQADRKHAQEQDRLRAELERRAASQADQIAQLRDKLAQLTAQLAENARAKLDQEAQNKRQVSENATLVAENHRLATAAAEAARANEDLVAERDRATSTKASLESALRLNETREKQINAMQEALQAEREKSRRMENARLQEIDLLRHQVDTLQQQCKQTERLRAEQVASFQDQLREQRAHTLRLTEELASIEEGHQTRYDRRPSFSGSARGPLIDDTEYDRASDGAADTSNRVIRKALSGRRSNPGGPARTDSNDLHDVDPGNFFISEAVDLASTRGGGAATYADRASADFDDGDLDARQEVYHRDDPQTSLVSDYVSRILDQTRDLDDESADLAADMMPESAVHRIPGRRPSTAVSAPAARRLSKTENPKRKLVKKVASQKTSSKNRKALTAAPSGVNNNGQTKLVKKKKKTKKAVPQTNKEVQRKDPYEKLQAPRWRF